MNGLADRVALLPFSMLTGCLLGVNGMLDDKAQGICFVKKRKIFFRCCFFLMILFVPYSTDSFTVTSP